MHAVVMENLEEYLADELTPVTRREIEAHLKACGMCREELAQMEALSSCFAGFRPEAPVEPTLGFYARVMRQVGDRKPVPTFSSLFSMDLAFGRRLAFSCLMTLAILGGYLVSRESGEPGAQTPEVVMAQQEAPSFDTQQAHEAMLATLTGFEQRRPMSPNLSLPRTWDPKVACAVTLALVFLCGAAAGAVAMNLGVHNRLHQPAFDTPAGKAAYFARVQRELDLTPAQAEQMRSVLNDMWQYYRIVMTDSKTRVDQLLTPEQRKKWERLLQEHLPR